MRFSFGRRGNRLDHVLRPLSRSRCRRPVLEPLEARTLLSYVSATNIHAAVSNSSAVAGDFNRDGKLDLVATDEANPNPGLEFLAGNGDGTFQRSEEHT